MNNPHWFGTCEFETLGRRFKSKHYYSESIVYISEYDTIKDDWKGYHIYLLHTFTKDDIFHVVRKGDKLLFCYTDDKDGSPRALHRINATPMVKSARK